MPRSEKIIWNGKKWTFTPGRDGSLISDDKVDMSRPTLLDNINRKPMAKAKVIMSDEIKNKRQTVASSLVKVKNAYRSEEN